ncbi:uncharacterized protein LOC133832372 [Humulus lupulus]|uniref:uncharacterized protein LOC133832372 n=1 Tax=Humulus lupulus TaxID=3486 RepID=UPI002B414657|nr:uncharacterized protein LOC133832372 [Humulus lupulus]
MEKDLAGIAAKAKFLKVYALGQLEFHVIDPNGDGEVNFMTKLCSYGMFQIIGIPCVHAVAAAIDRGVNIYILCSPFYTIEMWRESYKQKIYSTSNEDEWIVPVDIKNMQVGVPVEKQPVGRPKKKKLGRSKKKHYPSNGKVLRKEYKCSICGGLDHNRAS